MRALALVVTCLAGSALGQQEPVPRPAVHIGDSWVYRVLDRDSDRVMRIFDIRVTGVTERAILTSIKNPMEGSEREAITTEEWNQVSSSIGGIYEPHSGQLKFPMKPGDSWQSRYTVKWPKTGAEVRHDRTVKVTGWEDVQVPAGKFRALKVVSDGTYQRVDSQSSGTAKDTMWYVPAVKRVVKWTYEDATFRGRHEWWNNELVEYKVQ